MNSLRRTVGIGLALLLTLLPAWPSLAQAVPSVAADATIPGEVIVTLAEGTGPVLTPADLPADLQPLVARFAIVAATGLAGTTTYRLRSALGADPAEMAAAFSAAPVVVDAEPNLLFRTDQTPSINDPLYQAGNQWHLAAINAAGAWAITTGSPSVLVAVVDSGLDPDQIDLAGKVVGGYDFVSESFTLTDIVGHGTAVASFITANTNDGQGLAGLAPDVRLLGFRALGPFGGSSFDAARGVIAATDAGARVINCSFGGGVPSRVFQEAVNYAARKNVVVVAASGNAGTIRPSYPAAGQNVIAVGATNRYHQVTAFSQRGAHVAVVAPGGGVLGAVANGGHQAVINGTSFSAPIVSGVVALMLSVNPALTPAEVKRILEGTADDMGPAGFDVAAGWGRVNAGRAVAAARDGQTQPNRAAIIEGRVSGADPTKVLVSVEPFGEVVRPAADGGYRLPYRGRTTYTLRATLADPPTAIGPILVDLTGQPGEVRTVDFAFPTGAGG